MLTRPTEIDRRVPPQKEKPPEYEPDTRSEDEIGPRSRPADLLAREAARRATAQLQSEQERVKRETGELPIIEDEEYAATALKFGIRVNRR